MLKRGRVVNVYGYGWLRGRALTGEWRGSETEAFLSAGQRPLRTRSEPPRLQLSMQVTREQKKATDQRPTA